ncbi:MAG: anthranilate phosphoribosyltransferase [Acidiferrobacterales bacterium]
MNRKEPTKSLHETDADAQRFMRSCLQRVATGPELSKDLSFDEARRAMTHILDDAVDPVQAGVFLIALRMKRETEEENKGVLQAILDASETVVASVDELINIGDPYDGFTRGLPMSPFLPAVLAACGVPAVSHGLEDVGPKYGVTHRKILKAAGIDVDLGLADVATRIADPQAGWAYVDQRTFCPKLHALVDLRRLIVKRPVITTVETLVHPVRGRRRTHLMTGYVHKAYPRMYAMLARHAGFDSAVIVRGVEGGVIPSLQQPSKAFYYYGEVPPQPLSIAPGDVDIDQQSRAIALPADAREGDSDGLARAAAATGRAALAGAAGPAYDSLVYGCAICLFHLRRYPTVKAAADVARQVLDSGAALAHFEAQGS